MGVCVCQIAYIDPQNVVLNRRMRTQTGRFGAMGVSVLNMFEHLYSDWNEKCYSPTQAASFRRSGLSMAVVSAIREDKAAITASWLTCCCWMRFH